MRKTKVIFHIGAHKTGTSLLQKFMRDNRDVLAERKIYYLGRSEMNDYVGWGEELLKNPGPLRRRIMITVADPRYNMLLTSHENTLGRPLRPKGRHLYPGSAPKIDALGRLLKPFNAVVFLTIRSQDEFLESYYLQRIHEGRSLEFTEWIGQFDLDAVSWKPTVDHLRATFGRDRVHIVDFRTIKRGQNEFIRDFFHRIDPSLDIPIEYRPIRNPSISEKGLRMALAANPHLRKGQRKLMRKFLQKYFSNRDYPRPTLLSDEQRAWMRARYEAENVELLAASAPAEAGTGGSR